MLIAKQRYSVLFLLFTLISGCSENAVTPEDQEHERKDDRSLLDCPPYTRSSRAMPGETLELPDGYFVYSPHNGSGIYRSPLHKFQPLQVPNTNGDRPSSISISDDGEWICYVDKSRDRICLVTTNGCDKTVVPTNASAAFPTIAGFYRQSPYGGEIFYLADRNTLRAVAVRLENGNPKFGADRIIADLKDKYQFNPDPFMQISVVRDQVFASIEPVANGRAFPRTGYLTIPDDGFGIGRPENIYKWKLDTLRVFDGCGHTQSHDGSLCLANPGDNIGSACVPHNHKGFYITEFRRENTIPIDLETEHIEKYGKSINWCPKEYCHTSRHEADFWGWYFGNRKDYVIGRLMGTIECSVWMIHWETNTWYRLTPVDSNTQSLLPAVYFYGDDDALSNSSHCPDSSGDPLPYNIKDDWFNPKYKVISPNGGEIFQMGEQCTIRVSARKPGKATLSLTIDNGITVVGLQGFDRSIDPYVETTLVFNVPDSIDAGTQRISAQSDNCRIIVRDYSNVNYSDVSDGCFSIVPSK